MPLKTLKLISVRVRLIVGSSEHVIHRHVAIRAVAENVQFHAKFVGLVLERCVYPQEASPRHVVQGSHFEQGIKVSPSSRHVVDVVVEMKVGQNVEKSVSGHCSTEQRHRCRCVRGPIVPSTMVCQQVRYPQLTR